MNTMNMIFAMMMLTSATARMMDAPAPTAAMRSIRQNHDARVKFTKSCDTMKVSFLEYQDDKAYCGRMDWTGIVSAYSSDLSTIQPEIFVINDNGYFIMPMNYQDTYVILEGDIITDDSVEFMDSLENFLERNTNAKSYCNRIAHTGGGNVYRITEGTKEVKICGSAIVDTPSPPPPSPPTPPPSPPSSATTNVANITMFLAAIIGALFMI